MATKVLGLYVQKNYDFSNLFHNGEFPMVNMQIMEVFRNLSADDLKEIRLFLESGFNNRGPLKHDVTRLFDILEQAYPDFLTNHLDKNRVYEAR
jgi:hypothetical protein